MTEQAAPVPEIRHTAFLLKAARNGALRKAAEYLGQAALAIHLGVAERTLRSYLGVERGTPPGALTGAADALENRAAEMLALAARMRSLASATPAPTSTERSSQ